MTTFQVYETQEVISRVSCINSSVWQQSRTDHSFLWLVPTGVSLIVTRIKGAWVALTKYCTSVRHFIYYLFICNMHTRTRAHTHMHTHTRTHTHTHAHTRTHTHTPRKVNRYILSNTVFLCLTKFEVEGNFW